MTGTERDDVEAAARERYPSDRYEGALTPAAIVNARREAFVRGATWMQNRREPVVVDDTMVERAARTLYERAVADMPQAASIQMPPWDSAGDGGALEFRRDARDALAAALTQDGQETGK